MWAGSRRDPGRDPTGIPVGMIGIFLRDSRSSRRDDRESRWYIPVIPIGIPGGMTGILAGMTGIPARTTGIPGIGTGPGLHQDESQRDPAHIFTGSVVCICHQGHFLTTWFKWSNYWPYFKAAHERFSTLTRNKLYPSFKSHFQRDKIALRHIITKQNTFCVYIKLYIQ